MNGICIPCLVDFCVQFVYDEQKCGDDQVKDTSYAVDAEISMLVVKMLSVRYLILTINSWHYCLFFLEFFLEFFFLLFSNPSSCSRQLD